MVLRCDSYKVQHRHLINDPWYPAYLESGLSLSNDTADFDFEYFIGYKDDGFLDDFVERLKAKGIDHVVVSFKPNDENAVINRYKMMLLSFLGKQLKFRGISLRVSKRPPERRERYGGLG